MALLDTTPSLLSNLPAFVAGFLLANWGPLKDVISFCSSKIYRWYTRKSLRITSHVKINDPFHQVHDAPPEYLYLEEHRFEIENVSNQALKFESFTLHSDLECKPYVIISSDRVIACLNLESLHNLYDPVPSLDYEDSGDGFLVLQPTKKIEITIQTPKEEIELLGTLKMLEYPDNDSKQAQKHREIILDLSA